MKVASGAQLLHLPQFSFDVEYRQFDSEAAEQNKDRTGFACPVAGQTSLFRQSGFQCGAGNTDAPIRIVGIRNVFLEHAMGIEEGAIESNGGAHHVTPLVWISVIERKDGGLQLLVKTGDLMFRCITIRYGPPGNSLDPPFDPPTVKDAKAGNS